MTAASRFADFPSFFDVIGCASVEQLRHDLLFFPSQRFVHELMCTALRNGALERISELW